MTYKEADKRAKQFVKRYPAKKLFALDRATLLRDAYCRGLLAGQRRTAIKEPVRLKIK